MTDFDRQSKACPLCGQPVKVSSYRCSHCGRSLAAAEQREWESSDSSSESFHDSDEEGGIQIPPSIAAACLIAVAIAVVAAALYGFFPDRSRARGNEQFPTAFSEPIPKPVAISKRKAKPETTSLIRLHDDPAAPPTKAGAPKTRAAENAVAEKQRRDERLGRIADQVLEDLRGENTRKPDTVRLKSGREIECIVVGESATQLTIKLDGFTATLEREEIESVERQSSQAAEEEMKKIALARAMEIVDQGLARDGSDWITPEEKARRSKQTVRRETPAKPETQADEASGETPVEETAKPISDAFNAKTDREKLETLLSLLRVKGELSADFFGGALRIEDRTEQEANDSENPSFIAFEAKTDGLDISLLSEFLGLEITPSGLCDAGVEAAFDERDPSTLSGAALLACEGLTIPSINVTMIRTPINRNGSLEATLTAEEGIIVIERLSLAGSAYRITGNAVIHLSDKPDKHSVEGTFTILLNEPPTFIGAGMSAKSAQYLIDALAAPGLEILVDISGPLSAPMLELTANTPVGAIVWKIE